MIAFSRTVDRQPIDHHSFRSRRGRSCGRSEAVFFNPKPVNPGQTVGNSVADSGLTGTNSPPNYTSLIEKHLPGKLRW